MSTAIHLRIRVVWCDAGEEPTSIIDELYLPPAAYMYEDVLTIVKRKYETDKRHVQKIEISVPADSDEEFTEPSGRYHKNKICPECGAKVG